MLPTILITLAITFSVLKLAGVLAVTWWVALSPLLILLGLSVLVFVVAFLGMRH